MNQFDRNEDGSNGNYRGGYGFAAPNAANENQSQVSAAEGQEGELGANNGTQYLNTFSNYGDDTHNTGNA